MIFPAKKQKTLILEIDAFFIHNNDPEKNSESKLNTVSDGDQSGTYLTSIGLILFAKKIFTVYSFLLS